MSKVELVDKDTGWHSFFKRMKETEESFAKVGILGGESEGAAASVAEIALVQEFGSPENHIPQRSFIRSTFDRERPQLISLASQLYGQIVDGKMTVPRALGLMGASLAASTKATIAKGVQPPNSPATMLRKAMTGRTARFFKPVKSARNALARNFAQAGALAAVKPLIDTGRMLGSLTWTIVSGKESE